MRSKTIRRIRTRIRRNRILKQLYKKYGRKQVRRAHVDFAPVPNILTKRKTKR